MLRRARQRQRENRKRPDIYSLENELLLDLSRVNRVAPGRFEKFIIADDVQVMMLPPITGF